MAEINPFILIVIASAVIGLVVVKFLFQSKKNEEREEEPVPKKKSHKSEAVPVSHSESVASTTSAAEAPAKKKKKNRSNKSKAKKAVAAAIKSDQDDYAAATSSAADASEEPSDDESDADSIGSDAFIPSKANQALFKKTLAERNAVKQTKVEEPPKKPEPKKEQKPVPGAPPAVAKKQNNKKADAKNAKPAAAPPAIEKVVVKTDESDLEVTPAPHFDGWAVVEDKRKQKPKKSDDEDAPASPVVAPVEVVPEPVVEEPAAPPAPVIETITSEYKVDAKKIGLLIGPKGATKIAIQDATGTTIVMPKVEKEVTGLVAVSVTGVEQGVNRAISALNELVTKGYSTLIAADDFQESYVAVHHKYLPDIIGKGGAVIKALNLHTGVKITIPAATKTPGPDGRIPKVKVGLAGPKEKVSQCRALIKEITKNYVTPVTHPNQTFAELDIDKKYYNFIIGAKGSEIKHIQNNYKVNVHIPDDDSVNPNIVIVGEESAVAAAQKHVQKIIEKADAIAAEKAERLAAKALGTTTAANNTASSAEVTAATDDESAFPAPAASTATAAAAPPAAPGLTPVVPAVSSGKAWGNNTKTVQAPIVVNEEEVDEPWMSEFVPPATMVNLSAMLPPGAKYSNTPPPTNNSKPVAAPAEMPALQPKGPPATSAWSNVGAKW